MSSCQFHLWGLGLEVLEQHRVDHREVLGHASFCPVSCLSVGMLFSSQGPLPVFLQ